MPAPMKSVSGMTITVRRFEFVGNSLMSAEQLAPALAGYLNRPLDFNQLQAAAAGVAETYRKAGWVVRAYLPAQEVMSGTITIQVVEALFGGTVLEGTSSRVGSERLRLTISAWQETGQYLNADKLDRALLLADDLPGVTVSGALRAGVAEGETDLVMTTQDEKPSLGEAGVDNFGSRSSGNLRLTASLTLMSPFGLADQLSGNVMRSQGSTFARAEYSVPLGYRGLRISANVSHLDYELVGADFAPLAARGKSDTVGLEASYPLIRSRLKNLYLGINFDRKAFNNESLGAIASRYSTDGFSISLNGNLFDNLGGGGSNSGSLVWVSGNVDLNNLDPGETASLDGRFTKVRYSISRQQVINDKWSLRAALAGQETGEALDSSERFYLGGANGVRAYPASEGSGSSGSLASLELRWRLPGGFTLSGFHDSGRVRNSGGVPSYGLKGVGMTLAWWNESGFNLKSTWARRLGTNPNPTATGQDQDGTLTKNRFWLSAGMNY